jgi:FAD/FMN-containing dehydrogenase
MGRLPSRRTFLKSCAATGLVLGAPPESYADAVQDIAALTSRLKGDILTPQSTEYDKARRTFSFNPRTASRPAFIVRCKSEDDVARALDFAGERKLEIAVRSGGHDVLGASTVNNGVIIDLAGLDTIDFNPASALVRIGAGVRGGQLTKSLQQTDHAAALGCNPAVGVSGLTLGGGIGWLLGTSGAACDNLASAKLLTADGRFLDVSAEEEPDLFWAIRGGGGNFGIVTSLTLKTRMLGNVIGGYIAYPGERLSDFLAFYREQMTKAPDELVVEVLTMSPTKPVIFATICYTGSEAEADRVLQPWRSFGPPLADGIGKKPYAAFDVPTPEIGKLFQGPPPDPAFKGQVPDIYWMGGSLDALGDGAIKTIAAAAKDGPPDWDFSLGHYMHGAICVPGSDTTSFPRNKGTMTYHFDCYWFDEKRTDEYMNWVDQSVAAMNQQSKAPTYINYLGSNDPTQIRRSYGDNYLRLARIKRSYDPENIFHRNRNVPPLV